MINLNIFVQKNTIQNKFLKLSNENLKKYPICMYLNEKTNTSLLQSFINIVCL